MADLQPSMASGDTQQATHERRRASERAVLDWHAPRVNHEVCRDCQARRKEARPVGQPAGRGVNTMLSPSRTESGKRNSGAAVTVCEWLLQPTRAIGRKVKGGRAALDLESVLNNCRGLVGIL